MISKYSVKRPYTVLVAVVLVIVLGAVSLSKMTTDLLPDMSFQYALVITTDMGASPEQVESDVTSPIESAMATTSNIKNISSVSYNSYSVVTLEYEQNANMDSVVIEIQQSLDQVSGQWDDSIGTPMIMKVNPDMMPVLAAAVDKDGMDANALSDYVKNDLAPALESLEGVASVTTTGQLEESVDVTLDQDKIDALNKKIQKKIDEQFEKSQKKIDVGKKKVESGKSSISQGSEQLNSAINQTMDQQKKLYKTEQDLKKQLAELKKQKASLEQIQTGIQTFMKSDAYTGIVTVLKDNPQLAESSEMQAQIKQVNAVVKKQFSALSSLGITVNTYEDLPAASAEVGKLLTKVNTGMKTIERAQQKVESGKVSLASALDTLNANASMTALQVSASSTELANAASSLESAQSKLDEAKDTAHDSADLNKVLSKDTITSLLAAQNFDMPAGYAMDGDTEYLVRVGDAVQDVSELKDLPLVDMGIDGIDTIRLSDVAEIKVTDNSDETYAVINGNPGIMLSMEKQTGYSTGEVTNRILDKFKALEKEDSKLHLNVLMNQGVYIDMIVNSVMQNMIWGAILAILVLLLFLKDIKPTIVIACSIPLSVVAAIVLMYFTGITLNIISMSGLMLGIGMLVDNSIVVIENIYRLRAEGYSIRKAAVEGSKQVTGAIIASTLTTISVYAPIIFTEGITRQLFVDLALTIAYTLVASLVVALTFVPAMASVTLRKTKDIRHPWFDAAREWYGRVLEWCLRFKPLVLIIAVVLLIGSAALSLSKGLNFMDMDMETNQLSVTISAKEGEKLTFEELTQASDDVIQRISKIKGIKTVGAMAGGDSTMNLMGGGNDSVSMYILLDEDSKVKASDVEEKIVSRTKDLDCKVETNSSSMDYSSYFGSGLSVRIKGNDIDTLQKLAKEVADVMKQTKGTVDVDDGLEDMEPQLTISVDKEKAAEYGYTVAQVYQQIAAAITSETTSSTLTNSGKDLDVVVIKDENSDVTKNNIKDIKLTYTDKEGNEKTTKLSEVAEISDSESMNSITRSDQKRYIKVSGTLKDGYTNTDVSNKAKAVFDDYKLPDGCSIEYSGSNESTMEAVNQMLLMMLLGVILIYLIMVAQFQSLKSPFIIMFTIPLAFTGGFLGLLITGFDVSVVALLGFVMLCGIIVNNGIVLVDYINNLRLEGKERREAIVEAGKTRMRPILITAITTVLGLSTMALGIGTGSEIMQPIAIVCIGGLLYATIMTLYIVPVIYDILSKKELRKVSESDLEEIDI
mgnify:FL=1